MREETGIYYFQMPQSDVYLKPVFEKLPCLIQTETPEHGIIEISAKEARAGEEVLITVKPEENYVLEKITAVDQEENSLEVTMKEDGTYRTRPMVTLIQNGVVLQYNTVILGTTEYIGFPRTVKHGAGPILLQSHGDPSEPISYRNIWIRKM